MIPELFDYRVGIVFHSFAASCAPNDGGWSTIKKTVQSQHKGRKAGNRRFLTSRRTAASLIREHLVFLCMNGERNPNTISSLAPVRRSNVPCSMLIIQLKPGGLFSSFSFPPNLSRFHRHFPSSRLSLQQNAADFNSQRPSYKRLRFSFPGFSAI